MGKVSKKTQCKIARERKTPFMTVQILIKILTAEHDGDDGLIVNFSDGTTGAYVVEELIALRPFRERVKTIKPKAPSAKARLLKRR